MFEDLNAIDLTLLIDEQYPTTWPPHVPFVRRTWNWFDNTTHGPEAWTNNCGPYFTEVLIMDKHNRATPRPPALQCRCRAAAHGLGREVLQTRPGRGYAYDVAVTRTSPGWPAPNVEFVQLLLDRGVRCAGTDGPSMGAAHDGAPAHLVGLGGGMVFIEGLANLAAIPDRGAYFQFLPPKIARSSGGPGRAVAWGRHQ